MAVWLVLTHVSAILKPFHPQSHRLGIVARHAWRAYAEEHMLSQLGHM
jgi:hypothetical protein